MEDPHDYLKTIDTVFAASTLDVLLERFEYVFAWAICRSVILTESGEIGLGPKIAREGDILVILEGGIDPFVLRQHGEEYQLLGECYVYGISLDGSQEMQWLQGKRKSLFWIR